MRRKLGRPPKAPEHRKSTQISVRLTEGMVDTLRHSAEANETSVANEIAIRLDHSLLGDPYQKMLFGGPKTYAFTLLFALTLKNLRSLTGHSWHSDPFTFVQAKKAFDQLIEYFRPTGKIVLPKDLPPRVAGQIRRVSVGVPYKKSAFGREAAAELFDAVKAFAGEYGRNRRALIESLPEDARKPYQFTARVYETLGQELIPLHKRASKLGKKPTKRI